MQAVGEEKECRREGRQTEYFNLIAFSFSDGGYLFRTKFHRGGARQSYYWAIYCEIIILQVVGATERTQTTHLHDSNSNEVQTAIFLHRLS